MAGTLEVGPLPLVIFDFAARRLTVDVAPCDEPPAVKEVLYRIAQEALNNTVKHARATRVWLGLTRDPDALTLEVRDGRGFDPAGVFPGHLGPRSMRERAARLGGDVRIERVPAGGARIVARIPRPAGRRQARPSPRRDRRLARRLPTPSHDVVVKRGAPDRSQLRHGRVVARESEHTHA